MIVKAKNGTTHVIPDEKIDEMVENLDLSIQEAIDLWFEDNGIQTNEEQDELDKKAKKNGFKLSNLSEEPSKKKGAPRTVNSSDEKKELFQNILKNLKNSYENVTILNENKLIEVKINEKTFKINITENRIKKN